jgi:anti-anti-sigma regulatory factor
MDDIRVERKGDTSMLTIEGELTVEDVERLKRTFLEELQAADIITLDLEGITGIHFLCLQLLCSMHRTAEGMKKGFSLLSGCPRAFVEAVERAGFPRHQGCMKEGGVRCLWIQGSI